MADILSIPNCGSASGTQNIGTPICDIIRGIPLGFILLDAGVGFSAANRASLSAFNTELRTKTRALRGSRAYPFFKLTNFEDKSKEPTRATAGNLTNTDIITQDGVPAFAFQHRLGDVMHQQLMKFANAGCTIMLVDKNYVVYGTISGTTFTGFSLSEFFVGLPKFGSPSALSFYPFEVTLASETEYKESGRFIQGDSTTVTVTGIRDVVLNASIAVSVLSVGLTALQGKNLTDLYATELAQASAYVVKKTSSGAAVTVSPVFNSTTGKMDLTLSGAAWTGATTGDAFTVDLAASSVLAGLASPIDGYESTGAVTFLKP